MTKSLKKEAPHFDKLILSNINISTKSDDLVSTGQTSLYEKIKWWKNKIKYWLQLISYQKNLKNLGLKSLIVIKGYRHDCTTEYKHKEEIGSPASKRSLLQHTTVTIRKYHVEEEIEAYCAKVHKVGHQPP